jgi:Flp pilus assembly protein TadD
MEARQDLSRELRLHPRNISVWNNLAYLDFKNGKYRKADGDLSQGLALNPGNTFLLENRARLSLARQEDEKARAILLSLEAVRPWPKGFRLLLAIADLRTGRSDEARLLLNAILSDRPRDPLARFYLSRLKSGTVRG